MRFYSMMWKRRGWQSEREVFTSRKALTERWMGLLQTDIEEEQAPPFEIVPTIVAIDVPAAPNKGIVRDLLAGNWQKFAIGRHENDG